MFIPLLEYISLVTMIDQAPNATTLTLDAASERWMRSSGPSLQAWLIVDIARLLTLQSRQEDYIIPASLAD